MRIIEELEGLYGTVNSPEKVIVDYEYDYEYNLKRV